MRHYFILITLFFISCQTNSIKSDHVTVDSVKQNVLLDTIAMTEGQDTLTSSRPLNYVWIINFEKKTKAKNPNFKQGYLDGDTIICVLN